MPSILPQATAGKDSTRWTATRITALGEFLGSARWITTPLTSLAAATKNQPERPATAHENFADLGATQKDDAEFQDTELGGVLDSIADEVQRIAAVARDGVIKDFAARVAHARKHLPRGQVAATVAMLMQARQAALAIIKANSEFELAGRRQAVFAQRRGHRKLKGRSAPGSVIRSKPKQ